MDTLLVALDCLSVGFSLRCCVFIFYLNVVFSKECAKCVVMIQPTLFLLLCLTFAKHKSDISLAHVLRTHSDKRISDLDLSAQFG